MTEEPVPSAGVEGEHTERRIVRVVCHDCHGEGAVFEPRVVVMGGIPREMPMKVRCRPCDGTGRMGTLTGAE